MLISVRRSLPFIIFHLLLTLLQVSVNAQSVTISSPGSKVLFQQINGSADIPISAAATGLPTGGGVELILDSGSSSQRVSRVYSSPYNYTFSAVPKGEHTLDAFIVDASGNQLSATVHEDRVGVGDILVAVGDSITAGEDNIIPAGDTTDGWSADGRNGPFTDSFGTRYGPYESVLNDLLTSDKGYPHSVINAGWPGDQSSDGASKISGWINKYPTARAWLVSYGTNDANHGMSASAFQDNMQSITNQIHSAIPSANVYLSRVFYQLNSIMPQYEVGIGNVVSGTSNTYWGADLNTLFQSNYDQYDMSSQQSGTWFYNETPLHPNKLGIQKMAELWEMALMDRGILVTDGYLPTVGSTASHKIYVSGCDNLGLSSSNLMEICERSYASPPVPPGVSFAAPWSWSLNLSNAGGFSGGSPQVTVRADSGTLTGSGASSWNQAYLSNGGTLLPTSRSSDPTFGGSEDLISTVPSPGQVAVAVDLTPPVTTLTTVPASPDNSDGSFKNPPTISLSGSDSTGFPLTGTYYKWDSGSLVTYSGAFTGTTGSHTLTYYSIDQSGLQETPKTRVFQVNSTTSSSQTWSGMLMVSCPIIPDNTDPKPVIGFDSNFWYEYNPSSGSYAIYPDSHTYFNPVTSAPGRGFWAKFSSSVQVPSGTAPDQTKPSAIQLTSGWNMIGNPFLSAVTWNTSAITVQTSSSTRPVKSAGDTIASFLWGWQQSSGGSMQGHYYMVLDPSIYHGASGSLQPWLGYWIYAYKNCTLIIPPPGS